MTPAFTLVAHRAGNSPDTAIAALGRADMVEMDVHLFRGRVEVRHEKVLRPTSRLWERWYLLPRGTPVYSLESVLAVLPPNTPIHIDLKCFTTRAARAVRSIVSEHRPVVVSCRSWWVLRAFRSRSNTIMLRSCSSRSQIRVVRLIPGLGKSVGIVAHERLLDTDTIQALLPVVNHLFTWAVPSPSRGKQLVDAGVTGLIVDDLDLKWGS